MTTTTKARQTATEENNDFQKLITEVETIANNGSIYSDTFGKALFNLSTACVYSVLKKIVDKTADSTLMQLRKEMPYEIRKALNTETETGYNSTYIGGADDLIQTCVVSLFESIADRVNNGQPVSLVEMFTERQINKRVMTWKQDIEETAFHDVETCIIRQAFKAVRNQIDNSSACQTMRNGYSYIEDVLTDSDSDTEETIYHRLPKYADIGGYVHDFNDTETLYTVSDSEYSDFMDIEKTIESLSLTDRQKEILSMRYYRGYSQREIARRLNVNLSAVQKTIAQIQKKAVAIGLTADK